MAATDTSKPPEVCGSYRRVSISGGIPSDGGSAGESVPQGELAAEDHLPARFSHRKTSTGGLAGGATGLAYLSELRGNNVLARRAWLLSLGAAAISPVLLISDLGRPARFLNMLRLLKATSPMSVGSWLLTLTAPAAAAAASNSVLRAFPRLAGAAKPVAALTGLPLSTYTAALVSNTAVPVWHEARRMLPFVFGSGAALSAGAAAVALTPTEHARAARRKRSGDPQDLRRDRSRRIRAGLDAGVGTRHAAIAPVTPNGARERNGTNRRPMAHRDSGGHNSTSRPREQKRNVAR